MTSPPAPSLRVDSATGRWVIGATVLGSGIAFLDGSVVNVALPAIADDLDASFGGLQWIVNAYMIALSSLLLLGGSMGDRIGRRRAFVSGLAVFAASSVLCGLAPTTTALIAARTAQGVGAALLIPGSLSIITATFHPDDRAQAIGAWSGLASVTSSIGPFLGGWLIDSGSWRLVFLINVPLAGAAIWIAVRHVPETRASAHAPPDVPGTVLITTALASISYATIEHQGPAAPIAAVIGIAALVGFVLVERSSSHAMLPLHLFRSRQFSGTNLITFAVYAGLSGALFLVVVRLQVSLGYSALAAGSALVPFALVVAIASSRSGAWSQRIGARLPLTLGPLVAGAGLVVLSRVGPGDRYTTDVLPGVLALGVGMALTVAPLTAAVLASVSDQQAGVASGVNNAVSRFAGLLAVAALPGLAGIATGAQDFQGFDTGFATAMTIAAAVTACGGLIGAVTVERLPTLRPIAPTPAP